MTLLTGVFSGMSSDIGVPEDMGVLGETVHYNLHVRCLGKRFAARGMDSPTARHPAGLPAGPLAFHPSSGRAGCMHISGVHAWGHDRISDG